MMRTAVQTTIIRDRKGYELRDYGAPGHDPSRTLANQPPSGIYIVGKSGANETVAVSTDARLRLWTKARLLKTAAEVVAFMNDWGQISRWLLDDGSRPYEESYLLIEPHINGLKYLASFVESGDREGFAHALRENCLVERANLTIDLMQGGGLIFEAPSLLRFMIVEMWNEFGGEKPSRFGFQICGYCGVQFQVGGRRNTIARRAGAKYCSASCRNMASRARLRLDAE